jgi:hypothetical protein
MKTATLAIVVLLTASMLAPTAYAKKKKNVVATPPSDTSQAGGLPATNERVAALEGAVVTLRADLAAEIAARQAADAALANQLATIPAVFVAEGFVNNLKGTTAQVATKTVPAGTYLVMSAIQLISSQSLADAKARCVMTADGTLLADTSDLQFPILTTAAAPPSPAFGSTIFAPLQGSYSSRSPITFRIDCSEGNGGLAGIDAFVNFAALKVATVQ